MSQGTFYITVEDGTMLEVKLNKAHKTTIGVVHIFHGMAEHMDRYDNLVHAFNLHGYDVIRHNHRGHGKEITIHERGHYDDLRIVAQDAEEIARTIYGDFGKLPYIVLGHSMGSIIARRFVEQYPDVADGLILTGTGQFPLWKAIPAVVSLKLIALCLGRRKRLKWVNQLVYKSFNKRIDNPQTPSDWLSSQCAEVDKYVEDEYCGFLVSNQLIYQTVKYMMVTSWKKELKKINSKLPILLISGKEDPFGDYGKGVRKLGRKFKRAGIKHITVQLYKFKRHEILFEDNYDLTWNHMFEWIEKHILKRTNERG